MTSCYLPRLQDGKERTLAFSGSLVAETQSVDEFVAGNDMYNRWRDDDWFKHVVGAWLGPCPSALNSVIISCESLSSRAVLSRGCDQAECCARARCNRQATDGSIRAGYRDDLVRLRQFAHRKVKAVQVVAARETHS